MKDHNIENAVKKDKETPEKVNAELTEEQLEQIAGGNPTYAEGDARAGLPSEDYFGS